MGTQWLFMVLVLVSACSHSEIRSDARWDGNEGLDAQHDVVALDVAVEVIDGQRLDSMLEDGGVSDGAVDNDGSAAQDDSGQQQHDSSLGDVQLQHDTGPQDDATLACTPVFCDDLNDCTVDSCIEGYGCYHELLSAVPCGTDGGICVLQVFPTQSTCRACGARGTPCCNPNYQPAGLPGTCSPGFHCDMGSSEFYPNGTCW